MAQDRNQASQRYARSPDDLAALPGLNDPDSPLLLDFDETLWLRNSTEEFFFQSDLRVGQAAVLSLVQAFGPWRFTRDRTLRMHRRDWMRVGSVVAVRSTLTRDWSDIAAVVGPRYANPDLIELAKATDREVVVASNGFDAIIRPLMDSMGLAHVPLIASPVANGARWRQRGKLTNIEASMGNGFVPRATFVTDSADDLDVLEAALNGHFIRWPGAEFRAFKPWHRGATSQS